MYIGNVSSAQVSSSVWSATTRTLTNVSSSIMSQVSAVNVSIPSGSAIDLRPTGTGKREITLIAHAATDNVAAFGLYNGITFIGGRTVDANTADIMSGYSTSTYGLSVGNSSVTFAAGCSYAGWDWL